MRGQPCERAAEPAACRRTRVRHPGPGAAVLLPAALATALSGPGPAAAHPQFALSTVNRYGKLVLQAPQKTRLFFTLMVGDIPAQDLRQQADRNGDGTLDAGEQQGLAGTLRQRIAQGVHIYRGDAEVAIPWETPQFQLDNPAVAATAFAFEIAATLPSGDASAASGELRYDDRVELPPAGEIELRIEEGPGMRVVQTQSSLAAPPAKGSVAAPQLLFQWAGPPRSSLSDRSVRVRYTSETRPAAATRLRPRWSPPPWLLLPLTVIVAAAAAAVGFRRRK